jgi:hypothetical protein
LKKSPKQIFNAWRAQMTDNIPVTSPSNKFPFSTDRIAAADALASAGDFPGMYRYLSDQVSQGGGDPRLSN